MIDTTTCLTVSSSLKYKSTPKYDLSLNRKNGFDLDDGILMGHEYELPSVPIKLDEVAENVVAYIGGFMVKNFWQGKIEVLRFSCIVASIQFLRNN